MMAARKPASAPLIGEPAGAGGLLADDAVSAAHEDVLVASAPSADADLRHHEIGALEGVFARGRGAHADAAPVGVDVARAERRDGLEAPSVEVV